MHIFIVEGVRLPSVLVLEGLAAGSDAGLQGSAGAKGAKKGILSQAQDSWPAGELSH